MSYQPFTTCVGATASHPQYDLSRERRQFRPGRTVISATEDVGREGPRVERAVYGLNCHASDITREPFDARPVSPAVDSSRNSALFRDSHHEVR